MRLENYSRTISHKKTYTLSFNFRESNFNKVKDANINLSAMLNDYLEKNDRLKLSRMFPKDEYIDYRKEKRVVSSVSIKEENFNKVSKINIGLLIDTLLSNC